MHDLDSEPCVYEYCALHKAYLGGVVGRDEHPCTVVDSIDRGLHADGHYLFRQGEQCRYVYFVIRGAAKLVCGLPDGREQIIDVVAPGRILGLEGLYGDAHMCSAVVVGGLRTCRMRLDQLKNSLRDNHPLARNLVHAVSRELAQAMGRVMELGSKSAQERVSSFFVSLLDHSMTSQVAGEIRLPIPKGDMARLLGIRPETLSRILARMRSDGIIQMKGGRVRVLDRDRLAVG